MPIRKLKNYNTLPIFRIFIASPGDVSEERKIVEQIIKTLRQEETLFYGKAILFPIMWEKLALEAWVSPQRAIELGLPTPAECDVVVVIFWSRMGTPLSLADYKKPDGTQYYSGTEWEHDNAKNGFLSNHTNRPKIFIYRCINKPAISVDNKEEITQLEMVNEFFNKFRNPDGSYGGSYFRYNTTSEFKEIIQDHLTGVIKTMLNDPSLEMTLRMDKYIDYFPNESIAPEIIIEYIRNFENNTTLRMRAIEVAIKLTILDEDTISAIINDTNIDYRADFASMAALNHVYVNESQLLTMLKDVRSVGKRALDLAVVLITDGKYPIGILGCVGRKYKNGNWEVRMRAVYAIIELDQADSLDVIMEFKDEDYGVTRRIMAKYLVKLFREGRLEGERKESAISLMQYCINDNKSRSDSLKTLRLVLQLLTGKISLAEYDADPIKNGPD